MDIKTKFNLGDRIFIIHESYQDKEIKCTTCKGSSFVQISNTNRKIQCSDCFNGIVRKRLPIKYHIINNGLPLKIGKITVEKYRETYLNKKNTSNKNKIYYMCDETGVGSGTCWNEDICFKTKEEAQLECDKRNDKNLAV